MILRIWVLSINGEEANVTHFLDRWLTVQVVAVSNEQPVDKLNKYVVYVFYLIIFEQNYALF